ncbi:MAG: hypothetical protein J6X55_08550 [Victivallales bacterium]|nr:hypothetical protein [Victivallales bacterium]
MKKTWLFVLLMSLFFGFVMADDFEFEVKVAIEAPRLTRNLNNDLKNKAKEEALKKYLLRLDANMGQDIVRKATAEVDKFVEDVEEKDSKWENLTKDLGQLKGSFVVELKLEEINKWLKVNGVKTQGKIELTILEEKPSIGSMKLADGKAFFDTYTNFQRRVRDCIIKKVDEFGFDVNLLTDDDIFEEYKDKDGELVGVFYDPEEKGFAVNKELLKAIQNNKPDTLVLYYRIETLEYAAATKEIRVTIALSIKNLDSNVTKSFSSETFAMLSQAPTPAMLADDIGFTAEKAILKLMNSEGAGNRLNSLAMEIKNAAKAPAGPIKVNINGEAFDKKIRKKVLYQLKKKIVENGIADSSKMKSNNNGLFFEAKPEFKNNEDLYMEKISPIFEELGVEIDDDKLFYGKGSITIKP